MTKHRVALTGIGLMSALGATREAVWSGLVEGRCGIANVTLFDPTGYRSQQAAEVGPYPPDRAFSGKEWNVRAQSHTPSANIYAVARNFLRAFPPDDDRNRDRVTEIASPFSQDEPICRLEGFVD